ncbi:GntR family transcriptional regulator [Streptomyces bambusae]|uniref:GntR family transcriptional regulator n=1 Tax=Streptomyces bambusae TaxID=1550616 RepID=UPI001CFD499D|nr:GntR family transcriptional regulator [Streptomyces bambusae]MCB5166165.1 GntR family transcriptional regulator [Streptomyces bambusae]
MDSAGGGRQAKYVRIADELRAGIQSGRYGPGDRLPGENDLMAAHGVARMTARAALGVLQHEGLAEARKGAGVFVRGLWHSPTRRRGIQRLAQERWGAGRSVWADEAGERELVVDQVEVWEEAAGEPVASVLGVAVGAAVWVRSRRFVLDGKPVMTAVSWLPGDIVAGTPVTEADTGPGGTYARLAELGFGPVRFREEIRSRMPSAEEAERLRLGAGTPVVVVVRTAFAEGGRVVEVNEMTLDAGSYVLEYEFDA